MKEQAGFGNTVEILGRLVDKVGLESSPTSVGLERAITSKVQKLLEETVRNTDFVLQSGRAGYFWSDKNIQIGDIGCILLGLGPPIILRSVPEGSSRNGVKMYNIVALGDILGYESRKTMTRDEDDVEEFLLC